MIKKTKKKIDNFFLKIKNYFLNIIRLKATPHEIALGFAIGTFIEILPAFFGMDYLLALLVILVYPKVSKVSLFGALIILNAVILYPIHALNYYIGNLIYAGEPTVYFNIVFLDNLINISRRFLIGSLITAPIISTIAYFVVKKAVKGIQEKETNV